MPFSTRSGLLNRKAHESTVARRVIELEKVLCEPRNCRAMSRKTISHSSSVASPNHSRLDNPHDVEGSAPEIYFRRPSGSSSGKRIVSQDHADDLSNRQVPVCLPVERPPDFRAIGQNGSRGKLGEYDVENHRTTNSSPLRKHFSMLASSTSPAITHLSPRPNMSEEPLQKSPDGFLDRQLPALPTECEVKESATRRIKSFSSSCTRVRFADPIEEPLESPSSDSTIQLGLRNSVIKPQFSPHDDTPNGTGKSVNQPRDAQSVNATMKSLPCSLISNTSENSEHLTDANVRTSQAGACHQGAAKCPVASGTERPTTTQNPLAYTAQQLQARKPSTTNNLSKTQSPKDLTLQGGSSDTPRASVKCNSLLAAFYGTNEIPPLKKYDVKPPAREKSLGAKDTQEEKYRRPEMKSQEGISQRDSNDDDFRHAEFFSAFEDNSKVSRQSSGNSEGVVRHDEEFNITSQDITNSRGKRNESFANPERSEPTIFQITTSSYDGRMSHTNHDIATEGSSVLPRHHSRGTHHDREGHVNQGVSLGCPNMDSSKNRLGTSRRTNKHSSMIELPYTNRSSQNAVKGPRNFLKASDNINMRPTSALQPYSPLAAFFGTAATSPILIQPVPKSPLATTPNANGVNSDSLVLGETRTAPREAPMFQDAQPIQKESAKACSGELSDEDVEPAHCGLDDEKLSPPLDHASPLKISTTVSNIHLSDPASETELHAQPSASSFEAPSTSSQTELSPLSVMEVRGLALQRNPEERPRSYPDHNFIDTKSFDQQPSANHQGNFIESESAGTNSVVEEFSAYWSNFDISIQPMSDFEASGGDFNQNHLDRSEYDNYLKPGVISPMLLYANQNFSSRGCEGINESFEATKESRRKPSDASSSLTTISSVFGDCELSTASTSSSAAHYSQTSSTQSSAAIHSLVTCESYGELDRTPENGSPSSRLAHECVTSDSLEGLDWHPMDPSDSTEEHCYSPRTACDGFEAQELDQLLDELEIATNHSVEFKNDVESQNSLSDSSAQEEEQLTFNLSVFSSVTENPETSKSTVFEGSCDQPAVIPLVNVRGSNSNLKRSSRVPSRAIGTKQTYRRPQRSLSEGMVLSTQLPAIYEDHTLSPEEDSECFKRFNSIQQENKLDHMQRRVSEFFLVETSSEVMILDGMIRSKSPDESSEYQPLTTPENLAARETAHEDSPAKETAHEEHHHTPQQESEGAHISSSHSLSNNISTRNEVADPNDEGITQEDYVVQPAEKGALDTSFSGQEDMLPKTNSGVEQPRADCLHAGDITGEYSSIHLHRFDKFDHAKRPSPPEEQIASATKAKSKETEVKVPKPRLEYALLQFPRTILSKVLGEMNYLEFHALPQISRKMRQGLNNGEAKEVVLERFLGDVGYRTCDPSLLYQQDMYGESGRKRSRSDVDVRQAHRDTIGPSHLIQRDKNFNRVKPIRSSTALVNNVAKPPSPINLNLKDLHAFYTGLEFEESELSELAKQSRNEGLDLPTLRMIRAATRAHNKILMRVRSQPESLLSKKLYHSHGVRHLGKPLAPIFTPRKPAVLRVWVPTLGERISTEEIMECEREIWKAEIHPFVRRGDVCWNTAAGYKANQGKSIYDGNYLRELQVLWDPVGHLPEWLNMFTFSPSFYHHIVRSSNSTPVFYLDLTDFKDQVHASLNLCQDKFEFATSKAARRTSRYRVQRWVYRSLIEIKPGQKTGVLQGVDDLELGDHAEGVIHPGWKGKIVIEVEGTTEKARDLIDRCTKAKIEEFVPPHQLSSFHFSNKEERQKIARSMRQGQLTPWKIVRERSSPGEIWIQALHNPSQADFNE